MTPEWTLLREPEDFSALTDLAPDECVYGLGPDFETPGVVHLRADRRSMRKTSQVLSDWDVDPGGPSRRVAGQQYGADCRRHRASRPATL